MAVLQWRAVSLADGGKKLVDPVVGVYGNYLVEEIVKLDEFALDELG